MSKPNERRGPRVMHGGHKLFAQARDLSAALARLAVEAAAANRLSHAVTEAEAAAMVRRLRVAELRVKYINTCMEAFAQQADALPADHPFKGVVEQMLRTMRELLEAADRQVPR